MPTATAIANLALTYIGTRSQIASLTERSPEAEAMNRIYSDTRRELLQKANWDFAAKTDYLAVLKQAPGTIGSTSEATQWSTNFPAPPWQYEYGYPSDCLRMRWITPMVATGGFDTPIFSNYEGSMYPYVAPLPRIPFKIGYDNIDNQAQRVILTNQYQAIATYTVDVDETTVFSELFANALSAVLAAKSVNQLTGEASKMNQMYQMANACIVEARVVDGNEGMENVNTVPDWIQIRDEWALPQGPGPFIYPYAPLYSAI